MKKQTKIFLISILTGSIIGFVSISNNQNIEKVSQAFETGVTVASTVAGLLIILKNPDE